MNRRDFLGATVVGMVGIRDLPSIAGERVDSTRYEYVFSEHGRLLGVRSVGMDTFYMIASGEPHTFRLWYRSNYVDVRATEMSGTYSAVYSPLSWLGISIYPQMASMLEMPPWVKDAIKKCSRKPRAELTLSPTALPPPA
jgi:hypothetical protein